MAAIDFPDTPTVGQVFDKWTWNGTVWVLTSGAAASPCYAILDGLPNGAANIATTGTRAIFTTTDRLQGLTYSNGFVTVAAGGAGLYAVSTWLQWWPFSAWPAAGTGYWAIWISHNGSHEVSRQTGQWQDVGNGSDTVGSTSGQVWLAVGDTIAIFVAVLPSAAGAGFRGVGELHMTRLVAP